MKIDEHSTLEELREEITVVKELREMIALIVKYDKNSEIDKIEQLLEEISSKHSENMKDEFSLDGFQL